MDAPSGGVRPVVSRACRLRAEENPGGLLPAGSLATTEEGAGESRRNEARGADSGTISRAQDFDQEARRVVPGDSAALSRRESRHVPAVCRRPDAFSARPAELPARGCVDGANQPGALGTLAGIVARE